MQSNETKKHNKQLNNQTDRGNEILEHITHVLQQNHLCWKYSVPHLNGCIQIGFDIGV